MGMGGQGTEGKATEIHRRPVKGWLKGGGGGISKKKTTEAQKQRVRNLGYMHNNQVKVGKTSQKKKEE